MPTSRADVSPAALPDSIRVIVRDWLNANHVLFVGSDENVLVDAGHVTHVDETLRLVLEQLAGRRLHRLVNTHCHSDHMGGNAAVARTFGCPVWIPEEEAPLVRAWDGRGLWLDYAGQQAERFEFDAVIRPGDTLRMGDADWAVLAAPGHDMGALMFWHEATRVLISGDALWETGFGVVLPGPGWRERLRAARDTLHAIRALGPRLVIPGHGKPFATVDAAIDRCLSRIAAFEADETKLARHVMKVMFVFTLLERGRMAEDALVAFLAAVPLYKEYDAAWFGLGGAGLADLLLGDLVRSGAVVRDDGWLRAA